MGATGTGVMQAGHQGTRRVTNHLWYFAQAHCHFPSTYANNLQVMKACSAFAQSGQPTTLVVPRRLDTARRLKAIRDPLWEMYAVTRNFDIAWCRFPYPFYRLQQSFYALIASSYALRRRVRLAYTRSDWLAVILSRLGIATTLELHDYVPGLALRLVMHEARRGRLLAIVCISQALADKLAEFGCPSEVIIVAHDAVDMERFEPRLDKHAARSILDLPAHVPVVCYVGSLRYDRLGIETLLSGAAALPEVLFVIAGGDAEDVSSYQAISSQRQLNNVRFVGHVSNSRTSTYLFAADALLMPYTTDTPHHSWFSPMKMFEYLAAGRPIVASDFPVLHEVLAHEENVLFVEPANAAALVQAIRRVLKDESLTFKLSRHGVQTAWQYTWFARQQKILTFMGKRFEELDFGPTSSLGETYG